MRFPPMKADRSLYEELLRKIKEATITQIMTNGHVELQFRNGQKKEYDLKQISLIPAGQDGQPAY